MRWEPRRGGGGREAGEGRLCSAAQNSQVLLRPRERSQGRRPHWRGRGAGRCRRTHTSGSRPPPPPAGREKTSVCGKPGVEQQEWALGRPSECPGDSREFQLDTQGLPESPGGHFPGAETHSSRTARETCVLKSDITATSGRGGRGASRGPLCSPPEQGWRPQELNPESLQAGIHSEWPRAGAGAHARPRGSGVRHLSNVAFSLDAGQERPAIAVWATVSRHQLSRRMAPSRGAWDGARPPVSAVRGGGTHRGQPG